MTCPSQRPVASPAIPGLPTNWGRWGTEDRRGTLNHVSADAVAAACASVERGCVYRLAPEFRHLTPSFNPRRPPILHFMTRDSSAYLDGRRRQIWFADDHLSLPTHGTTHVDALAHVWYEGLLYNGVASDAVTSDGAGSLGVDQLGALLCRGVLVDVPRWLGRERLEPTFPIGAEVIEECLSGSGTSVRPGDAVLIRTGWSQVLGEYADEVREPGITLDVVPWLHDRQVSVVGSDNFGVELLPSPEGRKLGMAAPVHVALIRDMGMPLIELLDLEKLAADGVGEFLFVLAPLRLVGGTGSPLTPLAVI